SVLDDGKELYEFVEENIELVSVGLSPIYEKEGYLFVNQDNSNDIAIYRYQLTLFKHADEQYRSITTEFLKNDFKDISRTYQSIKVELAKHYKDLPNPATFLAVSKMKFPLVETFLPVAKRMLVRNISTT
ncbi:MAG: hypothetical protein AAGA66_06310, partial [Bacteroidota bacterium]